VARGLTLRQVERDAGFHNAHLSQIENDTITRPDLAMLWELSRSYDVDYVELMRLAGYAAETASPKRERQRLAAAFRAMGELTPAEQTQAIAFMTEIRERSRRGR
jgi:transcriptional regulator with XRE-family HTH domain